MKVLRVPVELLSSGDHDLDRESSHYVLQVHRVRPGARLVLFDAARGVEAEAVLLKTHGKVATCRIGAVGESRAIPHDTITLLQAFAKGDKMDRVMRDATALGVARIIVVATTRCVVRVDADESEHRQRRWRRIAIEAARQSGRGNVPEIVGPLELDPATKQVAHVPLRLLLSPHAPERLTNVLMQYGAQPVAICIGPEGGLTPEEESVLLAQGFQSVRFGDFTLRTETAATAVLGALIDRGAG